MREQQRERETKEREMAELRRQLQSAISPPAQPQKITAAVRRVSKPEANIMLLYTLCAYMYIHVHTLYCSKHM